MVYFFFIKYGRLKTRIDFQAYLVMGIDQLQSFEEKCQEVLDKEPYIITVMAMGASFLFIVLLYLCWKQYKDLVTPHYWNTVSPLVCLAKYSDLCFNILECSHKIFNLKQFYIHRIYFIHLLCRNVFYIFLNCLINMHCERNLFWKQCDRNNLPVSKHKRWNL